MKIQTVTDYLLPLREGGSLPALIRADDKQKYVIKFTGAGQGPKALIAEFIGGEIARQLGFNTPELLLLDLDPDIAKSEPDPEIQDLLRASNGINLGMQFLEQALSFNSMVKHVSVEFASRLVWLDAFITNVDRTPRNVNMLIQYDKIWLIDHGASLNFHYNWRETKRHAENTFPLIKDHVLLHKAADMENVDKKLKNILDESFFKSILKQVPETWFFSANATNSELQRQAYLDFFVHRLKMSHLFVGEAIRAREQKL